MLARRLRTFALLGSIYHDGRSWPKKINLGISISVEDNDYFSPKQVASQYNITRVFSEHNANFASPKSG